MITDCGCPTDWTAGEPTAPAYLRRVAREAIEGDYHLTPEQTVHLLHGGRWLTIHSHAQDGDRLLFRHPDWPERRDVRLKP